MSNKKKTKLKKLKNKNMIIIISCMHLKGSLLCLFNNLIFSIHEANPKMAEECAIYRNQRGVTLPSDPPPLPAAGAITTPPDFNISISLAFSSLSSRMSLSVGLSLMVAVVLMAFALSAINNSKT
jgi:hypothetical protein